MLSPAGTTDDAHVWRPLARAAALAVGAGAAVAAYATWVEPRWFALRRVEVPCLPAGAGPVRVLHLSDLHLVPRQHRKRAWIAGLADLEPDLVLHTGDQLADMEAVPAALEAYGGLLDRPGAFVLGSNDYYPPTLKNPLRYFDRSHKLGEELTPKRLPTQDLVDGLTARGWIDLTHRRARLEVAGVALELVGTDDAHLHRDDYASVSAPADPGAALTVGVTHAPYQRVLDAMTSDGARLLIAGHTHGGQLQAPFHGALVTNCDLDTDRVAGLSRWWPGAGRVSGSQERRSGDRESAGTPVRGLSTWPSTRRGRLARASRAAPPDAAWLHVSAGLGGNPYTPFRFCCRPEATLLTLTPATG